VSELDGKVALITGGASGIGRATALAFGRRGARVVVADVAEAGCGETVRLVQELGAEAAWIRADVTRAEDNVAMVRLAADRFGGLDCAVNGAGIGGERARTADYSESTWDRVIAVNLTGVWLSMRAELPAMLARGKGAIVNISSVAGVVGHPLHAAYSASKHGVIGLTRAAALEYARKGIRINAICPAFTWTPMVQAGADEKPELVDKWRAAIPLGRMGDANEVAESIVYLCSDAAGFVTGHSLVLDGGLSAG
jgi:NAD(P)-dependent dehydrogenase (short-subunit alcohol dehydrogenase family)